MHNKLGSLLLLIVTWFYILLSKVMPFFLIKKKRKNVLYLAAFYPGNAGYHWRVKKWQEELVNMGMKVDVLHVTNAHEINRCEENLSKFLIKNLNRRFRQVVKARHYETVIVRRELLLFNPYGNHFLEKLLRKLTNRLILDFDDDLSASKQEPKYITSIYGKMALEDGNSFRNSFSYYDSFFVASNYLKDYVIKYTNVDNSKNILVVPTCIDYNNNCLKSYQKSLSKYVFGWIGGTHNYELLESIIPVLEEVFKKYDIELHVIADGRFYMETSFPIVNKKWSLESETIDLLKIDIGLMPLSDNATSKGKGGFKLIQYMGLGIVSVASAITINKDLVENGKNGFLVTGNDWLNVLTKVINSDCKFTEIGLNARKTIETQYTFASNKEKYLKHLINERF